jgi:hypothetical protein
MGGKKVYNILIKLTFFYVFTYLRFSYNTKILYYYAYDS